MRRMRVGELKQALENIPDNLEVRFESDTEEAYEIILEDAYRIKYELPNGERFADTGKTGVDFFCIYGNAKEDD